MSQMRGSHVTNARDMRKDSCDNPHEKLLGIRRVSNPSTSIDPG